jgi:hypothetical protein
MEKSIICFLDPVLVAEHIRQRMIRARITQQKDHKGRAHREQRSLLKLFFDYYGVKTMPIFRRNIFKG